MDLSQPCKFHDALWSHGINIKRHAINTLQVNIGKLCNQACEHCHVDAGPKRTEIMDRDTMDRLLELLANERQIHTIDITGGAPELNPHFRYFVTSIRKMNKKVIDRCNLTVLFEPGQEDTAEFLARNGVEIIASLPCYLEENVDQQRGKGVFGKSISALQKLNDLDYGKEGSGLTLNLVYNPLGSHLPPPQAHLEIAYKTYLKEKFAIVFNQLFTITNMPIKRYAHMLKREGKLDAYMQLLIDNFNPKAVNNIMCKELISVAWNGELYDCDFNQMLDIPLNWKRCTIWDIKQFSDIESDVALANHCFGCTAGAGSSCNGALT